MRISATYASREGLGWFLKWRFTFEEKLEQNIRIRAFYKYCFLLPVWIKNIMETFWMGLGLLPLILAECYENVFQKILTDEYGEGRGKGIGFALFITTLGIITYLHPLGWIFIFMTSQFFIALWFLDVMSDYGDQLIRERFFAH